MTDLPCPFLPVPALNQTLDRYTDVVRPLQTSVQHAKTRAKTEDFRVSDGPRLQASLVEYARAQNSRGSSWLADLWLTDYLKARGPLQMVSNVGFQLAWPEDVHGEGVDAPGVRRAADFAHRLAAVHLQHLRGEMPPDFNTRSQRLNTGQRRFLAGGIRKPELDVDVYEDASQLPSDRQIVVLRDGYAYAVPVSDGTGHPLPRAALAGAFQRIIDDAHPGGELTEARGTFTDLSHVGSEIAAPLLAEMLRNPTNQQTYRTVRDALFVLDLADNPANGGAATALKNLTFGAGATYSYKPVSYQFGLQDGFVGVHVEHSILDGGAVAEVVRKALEVTPDVASVASDVPVITALAWELTPRQKEILKTELASVESATDQMVVRIVKVPFVMPPESRLSQDAVMQWIILYAQLATWGDVRSTYEAVDMGEYQAGRTESFRPHTSPAIELCRALAAGTATRGQLEAAARAHSVEVRAAKTGAGIERHLFGLRAMAARDGDETKGSSALFEDEGYLTLTQNFLSTSSLGTPAQVKRFAFAPACEGGIGVNYTRVPGGYEFCLTFAEVASRDTLTGLTGTPRESVDVFARELTLGGEALQRLLDVLDREQ